MDQEIVCQKWTAVTAAAVFLIVVIALLAERDVLRYSFTVSLSFDRCLCIFY